MKKFPLGEALQDGQPESYLTPVLSKTKSAFYEECVLALNLESVQAKMGYRSYLLGIGMTGSILSGLKGKDQAYGFAGS
jgi:hypothetical protein